MLTSHEKYQEGHKELFFACNEEELRVSALKVVDNVVENHSIWNELNYYKKTGSILGEHRIFKQRSVIDKVITMSTGEKIKRRDNIKKEIHKLSKIIRENTKPNQKDDDIKLLDNKRFELDIIEKSLGL
jgi:glycerol-3-phosphate cytidylyltransferase-like family protein